MIIVMNRRALLAFSVVSMALLASAADQWKSFSSTNGGFTVDLPAKPTEQSMKAPVQGQEYTTYVYTAQGGSCVAILSSTAVPGSFTTGASAKQMRDSYITQFMKSANATQVSKKPLSIHGYSGDETVFTTGGARGSAWVFCANSHLYGVVALARNPADLPASRNRMFNSFKTR